MTVETYNNDNDDNDQNDGGHGGRGRWEAFLQRRSNCHQREIIVGGAQHLFPLLFKIAADKPKV